jgi:protein phosphatase
MSTEAARHAAGETSAGRVHEHNEDSAYVGRFLYAVADGLGGHAGGEFASAAVIDALCSSDALVPVAELAEKLGRAIDAANSRLLREVERRPDLAGMGTTLTALLWSGDRVLVAHIGDSRAYLLREGRLRQITEDHALGHLVAGLDESGHLAPLIARYLDGKPDRSPDLTVRDSLVRADRFGLVGCAGSGRRGGVGQVQ